MIGTGGERKLGKSVKATRDDDVDDDDNFGCNIPHDYR